MEKAAAGRPGFYSKVGLHTFADPRQEGCALNESSTQRLVEVRELDGEEYLFYFTLSPDVCILRGTAANPQAVVVPGALADDIWLSPDQARTNLPGLHPYFWVLAWCAFGDMLFPRVSGLAEEHPVLPSSLLAGDLDRQRSKPLSVRVPRLRRCDHSSQPASRRLEYLHLRSDDLPGDALVWRGHQLPVCLYSALHADDRLALRHGRGRRYGPVRQLRREVSFSLTSVWYGQDIFVDALLAGIGIIPGSVPSLPSSVLSLPDVASSLARFFGIDYRLLQRQTIP